MCAPSCRRARWQSWQPRPARRRLRRRNEEGRMRLIPYLTFNGNCEAAFQFYEKCFAGKIVMMMTYGNSPMAGQTPAEWHNKVLHATLSIGDYLLQGADMRPE